MATNQCQSCFLLLIPCKYDAKSVLYHQVSGQQLMQFPSWSSSTSNNASHRREAQNKSKISRCFERSPLLVQNEHGCFRFSERSREIWEARIFRVSYLISSINCYNKQKIRIDLAGRYMDSKCEYVFAHIRVYTNFGR